VALDIKKILKGLRILNDSDSTKALELSVSGSTNTKTTVTTSQTGNRTVTLPDATDTLVGRATGDVFTNKSIDADTNTITNIENADIKSGAAIDAAKIANGTVDNTEFQYLNGVTSAIQTQLNGKEVSSNKGIASGYASLDVNGLVPTTQMPPAALERLVVVADQTARFTLTTATVQNGDTVYQTDTATMYFIKDDTNLGNASGYQAYSAGTAVNFSGALAGDIAGTQGATTYNNVVPVAKGGTNSSTALTNNKVVVSTAGAIVESAVTSTTLGYLDATSSVQTQLDAKIPKALTTTTGDMIYASGASTPARLPVGGSGQVLKSVGGIPAWATFSGGINYLSSNPDAEADTAGWATYADAAGTSPVDGTGGSPSSTFTRSTSSPLRGTASFLWTKSAANRQSEGFSYDFTIDASDKAKVLQISFDYLVSSGTYADSDMTIWIYDVTNAALIQPAGYTIQNAAVSMSQKATFQAASNSTSYRLIVHTASTSASAYTLQFDNFSVGPQIVTNGAAITDLTSFTPTGSWSTNTTYTGFWKRVGDTAKISVQVYLSGAPTSATLTVNLPSGMTMDTAKLLSATVQHMNLGTVRILDSGTLYYRLGTVAYSSTTAVEIFAYGSAPGDTSVSQAAPITFANGDRIWIELSVPIVGWSSNVQLSSDTDTRVVAMRGYLSANQTGINPNNSAVKINFDTRSFDTHAGLGSNKYTIPVAGKYSVKSTIAIAATNVLNSLYQLVIYKNGSVYCYGPTAYPPAASTFYLPIADEVDCVAGDYIEIYLYGVGNNSASTLTAVSGTSWSTLSVERLSGPSVIAASESVTFAATTSTTAASASTPFVFSVKDHDSHGAYSTANGKFTAPIGGKYFFASTVYTGGDFSLCLYKNGSLVLQCGNGSAAMAGNGSTIISLLAGDYVDVRPTGTPTATGGATINRFSGYRVGN